MKKKQIIFSQADEWINVWNNLPLEIKSSTSYQTFKRRLKTHLFSSAYALTLSQPI